MCRHTTVVIKGLLMFRRKKNCHHIHKTKQRTKIKLFYLQQTEKEVKLLTCLVVRTLFVMGSVCLFIYFKP